MSTATADDKEILAGLTEEERSAMLDTDGDEDTNTEGSNSDADEGGNDKGGDAGDDGAAVAGEGDAGAAGGSDAGEAGEGNDGAADEQEGEAKQAAPNVPLLVAEAPADAESKLKEIAEGKADLRKKYDDGDLTFEEYEAQKDALDEQRLEIKMAVKEAETASKMQAQQARNEFLNYAKEFTGKTHPEYAKDKELYEALDKQVIELANLPKYANLTGAEILEKAHKLMLIEHPEKFEAPAKPSADGGKKPGAKSAVSLPPNLAKVPSADISDTGEGRFAHLDRLAEKGGMDYERALAKLSDADREAYLAS